VAARPRLDWDALLKLQAVEKIEKVLSRRWRLGLGFATADGSTVLPPQRGSECPSDGFCQVVQARPAGALACQANARQIAQRFRDERARGALQARAMQLGCHAGLYELAVPVVVDGRYAGALLAGGIVAPGAEGADAELATIDRRTAPLSLEITDYSVARQRHLRLTEADLSLAAELLEVAAEAIGEHASGAAPTRAGSGGVESNRYRGLVGKSAAMLDLYRLLDRVVASDSTVLVQGENGTGKELIARAIHFNSKRRDRRFVVQNCSAFNDNLLDSELFGHKKGAFTGAVSDKQGLFEVADAGTFFLDEVGDMSPALQVKLLRVLQEGTFTAVGDTDVRKVDVRIIAATNKDLRRMVDTGEFREDLYYRLNVINIVSPPLRERGDDLLLLVDYFLDKHADGKAAARKNLSDDCQRRLLEYSWPGNVRELENEVERLVVLAGDELVIEEYLLSARIRERAQSGAVITPGSPHSLPDAVRALERRMIYEALVRNNWNKTRAAGELKVSRRNLIRLVQKYELDQKRPV